MNADLVHQFDKTTGQYLNSFIPDPDPKNPDRWLIPAYCTRDPLPSRGRREWPFRRDDVWVILPDFRGVMLYRTEDGTPSEIYVAGVAPAEAGLTEAPRPSPEHIWHDGAWEIDDAAVAQRIHDAAMAEFERRMKHARLINAGKADAYAAGLLSREDRYDFRAWSTYQLDLVRAIHADGFPKTVVWPKEPESFTIACGPTMMEYNRRIAKAKEHTDAMADTYKSAMLSELDKLNYEAWVAYETQLTRAIDSDRFPNDIEWPAEPEMLTPREGFAETSTNNEQQK